jgi:hypothetical protein
MEQKLMARKAKVTELKEKAEEAKIAKKELREKEKEALVSIYCETLDQV